MLRASRRSGGPKRSLPNRCQLRARHLAPKSQLQRHVPAVELLALPFPLLLGVAPAAGADGEPDPDLKGLRIGHDDPHRLADERTKSLKVRDSHLEHKGVMNLK